MLISVFIIAISLHSNNNQLSRKNFYNSKVEPFKLQNLYKDEVKIPGETGTFLLHIFDNNKKLTLSHYNLYKLKETTPDIGIVGIVTTNKLSKKFSQLLETSYHQVLIGNEQALKLNLSLQAIPAIYVIRDGRIKYIYYGVVTEEVIYNKIMPMIGQIV